MTTKTSFGMDELRALEVNRAEENVKKLAGIPKGKLKQLNLADITHDDRARLDFGDLHSLADSIREKGLLQPITVAAEVDGKYRLLAGERRLKACQLVGLPQLPALVRETTEEIDAKEIELYENVFRKDFTWDERCKLVAQIDALYKAKDIDWSGRKTAVLLDKSAMSVSRDIKLAKALTIMPELGELKTADEAMKMLGKMEEEVLVGEMRKRQGDQVARELGIDPGDAAHLVTPMQARSVGFSQKALATMLRIADSNYMIGDVFAGLKGLRTDGMVHLIECDPPYGIDLTDQKASKESVTSNVHDYNEIDIDDYPVFLKNLCLELYRVANPNSWLIFWFGPTWQHQVLTSLRAAKWQVDEIPSIWVKKQGQTMQPELYFARCYEPFYLCRKGKPIMTNRGRSNVFEFAGEAGQKKYHPTQRPVKLIEELLTTLTQPGNIVLVPFLGSGATLRACYLTGMRAYGWDMSDEYRDRFMLAVEEDTKKLDTE